MKRTILTFVMMALTIAVMAVPAKKGIWKTLTLSDGTTVTAMLAGDEHGHYWQAADGTCYVTHGDNYEAVVREQLQQKRQARLAAKYARKRAIYASTSDGLGMKGTMSRGAVPSIGEYTIPVVMVQFKDKNFKSTTTVDKMTRFYNEEGYHDESGCVGSVRDYFKAQSGGQFIPTFDVVGIVTLSNNYAYYGKNDAQGYDQNVYGLSKDVAEAAVSQLGVDFTKYVVPAGDEFHTAGVPLMCMFYAGEGEATGDNSNTVWPCEWDADEDPGEGNYQGVHFNSFFVGNELLGSQLMGMSVFCHEFGHALGLPDFYVTDDSYSHDDPFGNWSIMDTGAYVDDNCRLPMGYNAYEKSYMGWLELKEVGDATEIQLQSPDGLAENSAVIIRNSSTETFILENRQPGTWYPSVYGSGVLVTRISYNYNQWHLNTLNNTQTKKRACVLTADGAKLYYSASKSNLYGNGKTSIGALKTLSGTTLDMRVKTITKNNDGTITLTIGEGGSGSGGGEETPIEGDFYESFDQCNGKGGNDNLWSGSIATGDFVPDNEGWTATDDKYYGANQCAKFGTTSIPGEATTPQIKLNGDATLTFKAGAWNAKNDGTALNLSVTGGTIDKSSVTMTKGAFTEYTAKVTGNGVVQITFAAQSGRFFLDEVLLKGNTSGIHSVTTESLQTARIYTLDGRFVGTDFGALSHGLYIVNGKKVVK